VDTFTFHFPFSTLQTAITAYGTIPGMGHGCRSLDKAVRNCQRPLAAKQQFVDFPKTEKRSAAKLQQSI
jgi:hypothetical protein